MAEHVQPVRENPLGYAPIPALIRKFAIPSIISMLVAAAYNITDQIFIGHVVGMLGNAATNVGLSHGNDVNRSGPAGGRGHSRQL